MSDQTGSNKRNAKIYNIGWIAALPLELAAARAIRDEKHGRPNSFKKNPNDHNSYDWGKIGDHYVVLTSLPSAGIGAAAAAAAAMTTSFRHLRCVLMVGIGGGIPGKKDIRLGDVVVSLPHKTSSGVEQYDLESETYRSHLDSLYRQENKEHPPKVASIDDFYGLLMELLSDTEPLYVVVDALDESTKRHYDAIFNRVFEATPHLWRKVMDVIIERANGLLLLAILYAKSIDDVRCEADIEEFWKSMKATSDPKDLLAEAYSKSLGRIEGLIERDRARAQKFIVWVAYAQGPLTSEALQHAVAIDANVGAYYKTRLVVPVEELIDLCAGLVTWNRDTDLVEGDHVAQDQEYHRSDALAILQDADFADLRPLGSIRAHVGYDAEVGEPGWFWDPSATLLLEASRGGHLGLVKLLIGKGASPEKDVQRGALHAASMHGHVNIMAVLLHHGADINALASNVVPGLHGTALYHAQLGWPYNLEAVRLLSARGANDAIPGHFEPHRPGDWYDSDIVGMEKIDFHRQLLVTKVDFLYKAEQAALDLVRIHHTEHTPQALATFGMFMEKIDEIIKYCPRLENPDTLENQLLELIHDVEQVATNLLEDYVTEYTLQTSTDPNTLMDEVVECRYFSDIQETLERKPSIFRNMASKEADCLLSVHDAEPTDQALASTVMTRVTRLMHYIVQLKCITSE
ncbi:hypothetical protein PG994_005861 [Apiospora phragmitis]|uniref:Nucleoside phosphorylase domain-containing protein n=1 Tax=Apiospora phragmitis TaxID=2905665 RepID=A0ABR1VG64_9PEZI